MKYGHVKHPGYMDTNARLFLFNECSKRYEIYVAAN
jgi:hypothetical protein